MQLWHEMRAPGLPSGHSGGGLMGGSALAELPGSQVIMLWFFLLLKLTC